LCGIILEQTVLTNENLILDHLSANLYIIDNNLTLIEKEFELKKSLSSKGVVDILAKDLYGNFLIIESKRIAASSHETI
jgi:RecB family endonuclease NucS